MRSARRSEWRSGFQETVRASRTRWSVSYALAWQTVPQLLIALLLYGVVEAVGWIGASTPIGWLQWLGHRIDDETFRDLLAAGVGVVGALLGLYYATVGVVASTVYQAVPASIRTLFVEEPSGTVYVAGIVRAVVFGVASLTAASIGFAPTPLSLIAFALLVASSLLRLMILGGRIFNFFDPSALAFALGNRFAIALRRATRLPGADDESTQSAAYAAAHSALATYFDLAILLEDRRGRSAIGPRRLTTQLIQLSASYALNKTSIPTNSQWWEREPSHRNWMTLDHSRLHISLHTATGVPPELSPNRLWVEESLARVLDRTFAGAFRAGGSASALDFAINVAGLTRYMATLLQVEEALTLDRVWARAVASITAGPAETPDTRGINKLAAAEQIVMPLTNLWLGLADGAERVANVNLVALFHSAERDRSTMYSAQLPASTLELLETFLKRADDERAGEGVVVTPDWWRSHLLARSLVQGLVANFNSFKAEVDGPLEAATTAYLDEKRFDIAAVVAIASLELFNKVDGSFARLSAAVQTLQLQRNGTSDEDWDELPPGVEWAAAGRASTLKRLATCLPELRIAAHDPHRPDLHGQVFQYVFDATFQAILNGDLDLARPLFFAVFMEADQMRLRVIADLKGRDPRTLVAYALEPIVGLMELSGYARLMEEVDGRGIWSDVRDSWDLILGGAEGEERAGFFLSAASALDSVLAITPGGLMRTSRSQELHRLLEERGIVARDWSPYAEPPDPKSLRSPIIEAMAPGDLGVTDELADLFIADYLINKLPKDAGLSWKVKSLVEDLNPMAAQKSEPRNTRSRGRRVSRRSPAESKEERPDEAK